MFDICKRFDQEDRLDFILQTGRPQKLTSQDEDFIMMQVKKNPKINTSQLSSEFLERFILKIHPQSIRRNIKKNGYSSRTARQKPLINETNRKKRLEFAENNLQHDFNYWKSVIFTDESKFNIFGSDGRVKVWRKPNEELKKRNLNASVKHGGGSVMVWGCFSAAGIGKLHFIKGTMNAEKYVEILKENLKPSAAKLGLENNFKFYQDDDPKHKSYIAKSWLLYNCPKVLETPPHHQT